MRASPSGERSPTTHPGVTVPAPCPPRTAVDPSGLRLFTALARIAAATADLGGPAHAGLRRDLLLLAEEAALERPRALLARALVEEVVDSLAGVVPAATLELLAEARDDVHRPHPDLRLVEDEISAAG